MKVRVGGVPVDSISRADLAEIFYSDASGSGGEGYPKLVFSMNGEGVHKYHFYADFRSCIDQADIVHADGMSVVNAGNKYTEATFKERVATTDFFHDVAKVCNDNKLSMFFLGASEDVVELASKNVCQMYPDINFLGCHHGYFNDFSEEELALVEKLNYLKPDIVFVGLGRPRQEAWCVRMKSHLEGVAWLKTCGGLFDFLSGNSPRAPKWMIDSGLEWFYRMIRDPRRLFWRYFVTNIYSLYCYRFKR